jgi:hypothetical protein
VVASCITAEYFLEDLVVPLARFFSFKTFAAFFPFAFLTLEVIFSFFSLFFLVFLM